MKTKKGFMLRDICGEKILVAEGEQNIDYCNIINMNESAAYLWEAVQDTDFDADTLANLLTKEYEIDKDTALADSKMLISKWMEVGIVED